jgi:hypothetical protein
VAKASAMRSPELGRWLHLHGLRDCICTYLPTGTSNWYLYRVLDACPCDHPDAPPPRPPVVPYWNDPAERDGHG